MFKDIQVFQALLNESDDPILVQAMMQQDKILCYNDASDDALGYFRYGVCVVLEFLKVQENSPMRAWKQFCSPGSLAL